MLHFVSVVWGSPERSFPAFLRSENIQGDAPMAHTQNAQRDASASSSHVPHESATETENLKEMLSRLDQVKSIQDMLKAMNDGHGLGQRVRNETVRDDLWQRVLNTLCQIQSTTEQMLKLLTHGFGPRPSAAGSSNRQRVEKAEDQGGELQEKEEGPIFTSLCSSPALGDDEEAENQHKNEGGDDEEAEEQQEKEEGNDEEKEEEA
ncbi:unnamed protein product [Brassica rapa subsp. trilocularis]